MSYQGDCVSSSTLSLVASDSTFVTQPAGAMANGSDSDSSNPWPSYFVERPDGTHTALIEVDQLPELIRIRGLPPKLSAADTAGMTSVGVKKGGQKKYIIDIAGTPGEFHFGELSKYNAHENASVTTSNSKASSDAAMALHVECSPTISEACTSTTIGPEQEDGIIRPILRKAEKIYCTYWIARGECHYTQQGCRFKHEMPDLETLREIMGRRSFPKWWLESIGMQRSVKVLPSHCPAANNLQKGKRRAVAAIPKLLTLNTSSSETRNFVAHAPAEGLSSVVSKLTPRKDAGVKIRSRTSSQSGSDVHSPVPGLIGGNIQSSIWSLSNIKTRSPISGPSGSIVRPQISGASASESRSPVTGPSNNNICSTISESFVIHDKQLGSNIRAPFSGPSGNSMIHPKQPVSNDRAPIPGLGGDSMIRTKQPVTNDDSPTSGPGSNSMVHTTQPVSHDGSPLRGAESIKMIQTSQQPISNTNDLTRYTLRARALPASPLRIKIPQKHMPPFRVAVLPKVSSASSSAPIRKPRVNLPLTLRQSNVSSALGNTNGGKANTKTHGVEMEGGHNERGIAYSNGGSIQTTRPYDEVLDLLGPF